MRTILQRILGFLALALVLTLLSACGTLEMGFLTASPVGPIETIAIPDEIPTESPINAPTALPNPEPTGLPVYQPITAPVLEIPWATFIDPLLGIRFEYPSDWTLQPASASPDKGAKTAIISPEARPDSVPYKIEIGKYGSEGHLQPGQTFLEWRLEMDLADGMVPPEDRLIDYRGTLFVDGDEAIYTLMQHPDFRFVDILREDEIWVVWSNIGPEAGEHNARIFDHLLNSLTFQIAEPLSGGLSCPGEVPSASLACQIQDALLARDLDSLQPLMLDPFRVGYWASEGISASPAEFLAELDETRLPADTSRLTFTSDRALFPPLAGMPPERIFGPDFEEALVIYSEGWGPDGAGAALLYILEVPSGAPVWGALLYAPGHFDK